jgi:exosortase/archaeosortase family protein
LLRADVALVGGILSLTQPEISWQGTLISSNAHSIVVYGPCSSFHNISLSLLCWVALTKLVRPEWRTQDAAAVLLVCVVVLTLNTMRLCFMALGATQFTYWHSGFGADLFAWTTSAIVIGITLLNALSRFARS